MSVTFIQRNSVQQQLPYPGTMTVPYHTAAQVGDKQLLAISNHPAVGAPVSLTGGWTLLHTRNSLHSMLNVYTRTLTAPYLTANVTFSERDYTKAEMRTYRVDDNEAWSVLGSGDGLVADAVASAPGMLIRGWSSSQENSYGGSSKTLTIPAGLLDAGSPAQYFWYEGQLWGDDPTPEGAAAPTATATASAGGETIYPQWVNIALSSPTIPDAFRIKFPAMQLDGTMIELPNVRTVFPPMTMDVEVDDRYNRVVMFMPAMEVAMEGTLRDSTVDIVFPAMEIDVEMEPNQPPDFDNIVRALAPDVWWRLDAGDVREDIVLGGQPGYKRLVDASGNGYDAALWTADGFSFPDGLVVDSLDTAFRGEEVNPTSGTIVKALQGGDYISWDRDVDQPGYLHSNEFSAFVLAGYGGGSNYWQQEPFGRGGLWWIAKQYGSWKVFGSSLRYPYYWQVQLGPYATDPAVESVGFSAKYLPPDEYGNRYLKVQPYINGAQYDTYSLIANTYFDYRNESVSRDPNSRLDVGYRGGWQGPVQHGLYFKRVLEDGDFSALHAAAFAARAKKNKTTIVFPSMQQDVEIHQPLTGKLDSQFPAMSVEMYSYAGNRTPAGGQDWHTAAPLQRGLMSAPSPRSTYQTIGNPINPYYSAWFKWTADTTDTVWFSTLRSLHEVGASSMDTVMVGYLLADGVLHEFAYSDDVANFSTSQLVFENPVVGETYYIRVGTFDDSGDGVAAYVIDNDLVPMPTLADLIVIGGSQSPAGYIGNDGLDSSLTPTALTNSVSAPTSIPPGEQAWWLWTAEYTGTVSFDALLSQQWLTNGTGVDGPLVDIELWTDGDFLAYSEEHGTSDYVVKQGQITWDVNAGQTYHIKLHSSSLNIGPINGLIRISQINLGAVVVPAPKTFIVDATPLDRNTVAGNYGYPYGDPGFKYIAETADPPILTNQNASAESLGGFQGAYHLSRAFAGTPPQLDYEGVLRCLWSHARTGNRGDQWWSLYGDGSGDGSSTELSYVWNGTDPYDFAKPGHGTCRSPWYELPSDSTNGYAHGAAGTFYHSTWDDTFFLYADAYMDTHGSHFRMSVTQTIQAIRDRSDVHNDASLVSIGVMADTPVAKHEGFLRWYGNITPPVGSDVNPHLITWGPGENGWWSSGSSDAEVGQWMAHPLVNGIPPAFAGGYYDINHGGAPAGEYTNATVAEENLNNIFVPYSGQDQYWTPLDPYLLNGALAYEANPANSGRGGLTLAYLDPHLDSFEPPSSVYKAFGYPVAASGLQTYAHRLLMKVTVQEAAYAGSLDPLGIGGTGFPAVRDFSLGSLPPFPDFGDFDPGTLDQQILFGPYPINFQPALDVLCFGPRHKPIVWPAMELGFAFNAELLTHDPVPSTDPLIPAIPGVRFQMPEFTLVQGIPVAAKATGRIAFTSETVTPHLSTQLYAIAHAVSLGETTRLSPFNATHKTRTSSFRRQPNSPLEYRTSEEVIWMEDTVGPNTLQSLAYRYNDESLPAPERVSSYAYWRGNPAATTAISFRPNDVGEEALTTYDGSWFDGDEVTILISAVINDNSIVGQLSPLFVTQAPDGTPGVGLFFNRNSELLWWDYRLGITDVNKRVVGSLQLLDDIRRVSQPVLVGARMNNATGKVTLVAADSRLRTVETSMTAPIPSDHQLRVGDAGALTAPGAFDMLDMRWWVKDMADHELLSAAAAMADLWGVLL